MPSGGYDFFTDATNAGFLKRDRNFRELEPTASGFYPITSQAFLQNENNLENTPACFYLTFDRSIGVASLTDDTIDILINRRTLKDDFRGVGEALNETYTVSGRIGINLSPEVCLNSKNMLKMRMNDKLIRSNPVIAVKHEIDKGMLLKPFPNEIHLLTLKREGNSGFINSILIRLENLVETNFELDLLEYIPVEPSEITKLTLAGTKMQKLSFQGSKIFFKPLQIVTLSLKFN